MAPRCHGAAAAATSFLTGADPPDAVADVVGHQQRPVARDLNADRTAQRLAVATEEAGENVDRRTGRAAVDETHEDQLVAAARASVPGAVQADESAGSKAGPRRAPSANVNPSGAT